MVYKVNTRGRKVEEKLKDSNVSKNVSTKRRPQSSRFSSSSACPTSVQNPSITKTKSSKADQDNGAAIIPKETVGTKTVLSTSTVTDHQTSRSNIPLKTVLDIFNDLNRGKKLIIPVVMLDTRNIPLHKVQLRSVNNLIKQQEIKPTHDQIEKQIVPTTQLDKTPPRKRGRKRPIDVQTICSKQQKSNKSSTKTTSENVAKSNTSIKNAEPPAKSTRMSLKLRTNESENKTHDEIQKQIVPTTQLDKTPPKKRGRKRQIDVQTICSKPQKSNKSSTKTTSENVAKKNTSIKDAEPPAKSTRMSLKLRKNESENNSTTTTSQNVAKSNTSIKEVEPTAKRTRRKTVCG